MAHFGLIGRNINYSYSALYFKNQNGILHHLGTNYDLFNLENLNDFRQLFFDKGFSGINVTKPYKKEIIQYLDQLSPVAKKIGAVNTIHLSENGLVGYNTDAPAFEKSISNVLSSLKKALILGSGGASDAVRYILTKNNIETQIASRSIKVGNDKILYSEITDLKEYDLIVNATPLGMHPNKEKPILPYHTLNISTFVYDLNYNPSITPFLQEGLKQGLMVKNGLDMLQNQAQKSWAIWESEL